MSIYRATSWGRTRRPKDMVEDVPASKQTATTVTVVAKASLSNNLTGTNAGENGYITENQRFLHVWVNHDSAASKQVEIYAYNYAFGAWAKLFLPLGNGTLSEAVASNGATGPTAHMFVFEISGIDRVAFVSTDAPATVRAACSTF